MKTYTVAFGRDSYSPWRLRKADCPVFIVVNTKEEASARRVAGGDLVFDMYGAIVKEDWWLWDNEKKNPDSYARRAQDASVFLSDF